MLISFLMLFFFFQAEDGIRDRDVTGVQTCALPIWLTVSPATHLNGTDAAIARAIILVASFGLVAKPTSGGTYVASRRSGSSVHSFGRYNARSMNAWP